MTTKIFIPKATELSEEFFSELEVTLKIKFSEGDKQNMRAWHQPDSNWDGTVINPSAQPSHLCFPLVKDPSNARYLQEQNIITWTKP